mgnify:CR=1 FL=1
MARKLNMRVSQVIWLGRRIEYDECLVTFMVANVARCLGHYLRATSKFTCWVTAKPLRDISFDPAHLCDAVAGKGLAINGKAPVNEIFATNALRTKTIIFIAVVWVKDQANQAFVIGHGARRVRRACSFFVLPHVEN